MRIKKRSNGFIISEDCITPCSTLSKRGLTIGKFKKGIHSNLLYTEKFLRSNNLVYEIHSSPGKKDFTTETLDFADQIEADLLIVTATRNIGLADYVLGANEQKIIANPSGIPVMCINPRQVKMGGGFSATGG